MAEKDYIFMSKQIDQRFIEYIKGLGIQEENLNSYLHPKLSDMLDPMNLHGMAAACEKIKAAIKDNKNILVFGDYDCDGISAASIMLLHLKSLGAKVDAFIPSRFDDGYGLSKDTIDELCRLGKPDLLITVDLGITAVTEVEILKERGIDVIVTDHHEPINILPDCIVIDAKIAGQSYGFDGLCGAGVALKLVEALSGRQATYNYLDICAIATIGDIVPLISENRVIAKLGLQKINEGKCLESIKYMMQMLGLSNLTSEDVSYRLVPRLNASGRMDNGKKVLDFLIATDNLPELYGELEKDNVKRLQEISDGNAKINEELMSINLNDSPALLVCGDFHQGVLGILASRVCHDYNRPAIIFTKTQEGTLKGSGRSLDSINIHSIISELSSLCLRFGGHKMAIGVELLEENFAEFKQKFLEKLAGLTTVEYYQVEQKFDIEISEQDINPNFVSQLSLLEPFGCCNERPIFGLVTGALVCEQMKGKNYKHYKLHTTSGKQILAFNGYNLIELLRNNCQKLLFVDLEQSEFKGKMYTSCKLRGCKFLGEQFTFNSKAADAASLLNKYISVINTNGNLSCVHLSEQWLIEKAENLAKNSYGTVIVCQSQKVLSRLLASSIIKNNYVVSSTLPANKQNCILLCSRGLQEQQSGYNNYIYFRSQIKNEHYLFDQTKQVFDCSLFGQRQFVDTDRLTMAECYKTIKGSGAEIFANDLFELADKLAFLTKNVSSVQMMFALLVFADLGLISFSGYTDPVITINENSEKTKLTNSKYYNAICNLENM